MRVDLKKQNNVSYQDVKNKTKQFLFLNIKFDK